MTITSPSSLTFKNEAAYQQKVSEDILVLVACAAISEKRKGIYLKFFGEKLHQLQQPQPYIYNPRFVYGGTAEQPATSLCLEISKKVQKYPALACFQNALQDIFPEVSAAPQNGNGLTAEEIEDLYAGPDTPYPVYGR